MSKITLICLICQKPFTTVPANRGIRKTCSRPCSYINRSQKKMPYNSLEEHFWTNVDKSGDCWFWTAGKDADGYGKFTHGRAFQMRAHRYSWELHNGPIPVGFDICHDCPNGDNPTCVRPTHLFAGTPADNMTDRDKKGRQARWETCHLSKLTIEKVRLIRLAHSIFGYSNAELGRKFNVSAASIWDIVHNNTWKDLPN